PDRVVPKAERASRASLLGITNSYFDGLTTHDGTLILAHSGCMRLENGNTVAPRAASAKGPATDCTSNLTNFSAQNVAARRYPIVDEEAQVVLALGVFVRRPGINT